jgi:L-threonylcarbamoyladenylate synthase
LVLILPTHTSTLFKEAVARAAELLRAGEVVALPTETVYGLAANALNARAVARVFEVKGRPAFNPVIVHVAGVAMGRQCVSAWPAVADKLARAFWPGPLTLVLPRSTEIPDIVTAGGPTVGIRWPSHPFIQEVMRVCNFPLAVPSANLASQVSPTTAEHVRQSLGARIPLIVDGGPSQVGIESTVLDLVQRPPRVLRPGMIQLESLRTILGEELGVRNAEHAAPDTTGAPLRSPGRLPKHYAPRAKLVVLGWRNEADLKARISEMNFQISKTHIVAHSRIPSPEGFGQVRVLPHDAEAFARGIYAALHHCDEEGAELIVVEALPAQGPWEGISDRLRRGASPDAKEGG